MIENADHILSDDHRDVDLLLLGAIEELRDGTHRDAFDALDLFWARLAMHIRAEHLHLFPAVLNADDRSEIPGTIEMLRRDHDYFMHELADAIKKMRSTSVENERAIMRATADRLGAIKTRLVEHNTLEEEIVYPIQASLPPEDAEQLRQSIETELKNLPLRFLRTE